MARKIAIIGLGYAGLHTAIAFGEKKSILGFDIDATRVEELQQHHDRNGSFSKQELQQTQIEFTTDLALLAQADFYIVIVPTPINKFKEPDFECLISVSTLVASCLKKGDIVVYESTVYPGATEEHCLPLLEVGSQLEFGKDFSIGYSPERVNPGDKIHTFTNTIKIISASDAKTLAVLSKEYGDIVKAGVYPMSSVKAAEAVKIIENTQRDVNIGFINEMAQLLHKLNLDTKEVLDAAETKWNFVHCQPGLVGGHCISVDPYYLIHKANEVNYFPEMMIAARRINDEVATYIAGETIKQLAIHNLNNSDDDSILILGITYKENCSDIRNSKVASLVGELQNFNVKVHVYDPHADKKETLHEYGIKLENLADIPRVKGIVFAVSHADFISMSSEQFATLLVPGGIIMDIKGVLDKEKFKQQNIHVWRM